MRARMAAVVLASVGLVASGCGLLPTDREAAGPEPAPRAEPRTEKATEENSALATAKAKGARVEVIGGRTETRQLYAEPNGTLTAVIGTTPQRVKRNGSWVPVDTGLQRTSGGSVVPKALPIDLAFSGGGSTTPLVSYGKDGHRITLTWPGRLPAPKLTGDKATYAEVLPGIDLVMRAKADGYSQYVVVKNARAAAQVAKIELGLKTTGVTLTANATGALQAKDAKGKVLFSAPESLMWDAGNRQSRAAVAVSKDKLTLVPDKSLLHGRATKYPVTIDPDLSTIGWNWGGGGWTSVLSGSDQARWNSSAAHPWAQTGQCWNGRGECNGIGEGWSYFQYNTGGLGGTHILGVTLDTIMESGPDCNAPRNHQLFIAGGRIDGGTRWGNKPAGGLLYTRSVPGCGRNPVGFSAGTSIHHNDGGGISTYFLKAENSGDQLAWRKYDSNQTYLRVNFNRIPNPAYSLSTDPALPAACKHCAGTPYLGGDSIRLIGHLSDNDPGQHLRPEYDVYTNGVRADVDPNVWQITGAAHSTTLDLKQKHGTTIEWYLRGADEYDVGGYAKGPGPFAVDRDAPDDDNQKPGIDARLYKADNRWHGGEGVKDTFTLTAKNATDIDHFYWGWTSPPTNRVDADALGGKALLELTPPGDGPRDLFVQAADRADNRSKTSQHHFYVRAGNGPLAQYALDGTAKDSAFLGDRDGTLTGGTTYTPGALGSALRTDGEHASAMTAPPAIRTDTSFTVSAWVNLDKRPVMDDHTYTAVSQDGVSVSGLFLGYRRLATGDQWEFYKPATDDYQNAGGAVVRSTMPARVKTWTQLTGVYDAYSRKITLYVNGEPAGTATMPASFNAGGKFQVGDSRWNAQSANPWPGTVDEVKVYDRPLSADEVKAAVSRDNVQAGQWKYDELDGTTAANGLLEGEKQVLQNGAKFTGDRDGDKVSDDGAVFGGLDLDGTDDFAATSGPVVRTDQSFTVSAWVNPRTLAAAGKATTFASQDGQQGSGFMLQQRETGWSFVMPGSEAAADFPIWTTSSGNATVNTWTHVTGVYDAVAGKSVLYVNGQEAATDTGKITWSADGPFAVGRARLHGGLMEQFPGLVDEVRTYHRALSATEVQGIVSRDHVPVGEWKLDGNADGRVPVQNGALGNSPEWTAGQSNVPDQTDLAVRLNGTSTHVTAPHSVDVTKSFSVAGWAKLDSDGQLRTVLAQDGTRVSSFKLRATPDNRWSFVMFGTDVDGGATRGEIFGGTAQTGVWTHLVAVYDAGSGQLNLYVNGVLAASKPWVQPWNHAAGKLQIGRSLWGAQYIEYFPGAIDDVSVYSRVLFAEEIRAMAGHDLSLVHHWQLDEPSGANASDTVGARAGTAVGGATRSPGRIGNAIHLDGTDDAVQSTGIDLRTDDSFTVSAWVQLDRRSEPESQFTAVSVDGTTGSKFRLGHVADLDQNLCLEGIDPDPNKCGAWIFELPNTDGGPPLKAAVSTLPAEITKWTLLTGVYDRKTGQILLYVDGSRVGDGTVDNAWASTGKLQIGRGLEGGNRTQYWPGSVDDVRLYAGALDKSRISNLFRAYPVARTPDTVPPADAGHWKLDENTGTTAVDTVRGQNATLKGGATWIGGRTGPGGWFDGTTGYAETAGKVLDTDKSFSASAWVYLTGTTTGHRTVLAQDGTQSSAFLLQYQEERDKWVAVVPGTTGGWVMSTEPAAKGEWTHLAVVYDAFTQQLRLYVQGSLSGATTGIKPAASTGPFTIGRGKWEGGPVDYFSRGIDDVRTFGKALTDGEVKLVHDDVKAVGLDFYRFDDGTARDYTTRKADGTASGTVSYVEGVNPQGKAIQLDGSTGSVRTAFRTAVMGDSFTVSAWARLTSKSKVATVVGQDGQRRSGFVLQYRPGLDRWVFGGPAADSERAESSYAVSAKQPLTNQWVHLSGVYDRPSGQLRLYVDGDLSGTKNLVNPLPNATGSTTIGRGQYEGQPADFFPGAIDEVRTELGVATAAELAQRGGWAAPPTGQLGRYLNAAGDHYTDSTDKPVRAGYRFEGTLGLLAPNGPGTRVVYGCQFNGDGFSSIQADCEGKTVVGPIGRLWTAKPANVAAVPVYRCNLGPDHVESPQEACEGGTNEGLLGYAPAYAPLGRYYSSDNRDHWTTVFGTAPSYKLEGTMGWLPRVQLPGTQALRSCMGDSDEFTSTDAACEGKTVVASLGYVYTEPPADVATVPLYRCAVNGQKFVSRSATCDGYTVDRLLGHIPTAPPVLS